MNNYINTLIQLLAHTTYTKLYGIKDKPVDKIEVHLSDRDNDWNILAISKKTLIDDLSDITIREHQPLKITTINNDWNQLAINHGSKKPSLTELHNH